MTTHCVELTVEPDPDFTTPQLMGALFSKLHRRLAEMKCDDIGVSFPAHRLKPRHIGHRLRIHGSAERLDRLMETTWLKGVREHVSITAVFEAPETTDHRRVQRRQPKTNVERLRRRRMKRHDESAETARERIPDHVVQNTNLPFVQVSSISTGQRFSLFVAHEKAGERSVSGPFNSYGLSSQATVPWF